MSLGLPGGFSGLVPELSRARLAGLASGTHPILSWCKSMLALGNDFDGFGSEMGAKIDPKCSPNGPNIYPKRVSDRVFDSELFF